MQEELEIGTSGRKRSGKARMSRMTAEERKEFGRRAAAKRWAMQKNRTVYDPEAWGDLPIIGHTVPCAVILDEGEVVRPSQHARRLWISFLGSQC